LVSKDNKGDNGMNKKVQTVEEIITLGISKSDAEKAIKLWKILEPCLKIKPNGRVNTSSGDKTVLGLYLTITNLF
jgi:hypothetical protein